MDLNHGVAFSGGNMEIYAGEYTDCCNADLVVLTAGLPQKEGQNRLDLLKENRKIFETILQSVLELSLIHIYLFQKGNRKQRLLFGQEFDRYALFEKKLPVQLLYNF